MIASANIILLLRSVRVVPLVLLLAASGHAQNTGQGNGPSSSPVLPPAGGSAGPVPPELQQRMAVLAEIQSAIPPNDRRSAGTALQSAALAKARDKVRSGDLAAAGDFLTATNPFQAGTSQWHMDAAQRWLALAEDFSKGPDRQRTPTVVTRTLQHLDEAAELARRSGDTRGQADAKSTTGFLHERYRGDPNSAIASYKAALQLQPNDRGIREALTRLEKSLAILQARARSRK